MHFFFYLSLLFFLACEKSGPEILKKPIEQLSHQEKIKRGQIIYQKYCTSCHHSDPKLGGTLGPKLNEIDFEILKSKVLTGLYPASYDSAIKSKIMESTYFPSLSEEIDFIYLYLNQKR